MAAAGWPNLPVWALLLGGTSVPSGAYAPTLGTVAELLAVPGAVEIVGQRKAAAALTVTQQAGGAVVLDADLSVYAAAALGTVRAVVFYVEAGSDSTRDLVALIDGGLPVTTTGTDLTVSTPTGVLVI
jgi:hypothetical protein